MQSFPEHETLSFWSPPHIPAAGPLVVPGMLIPLDPLLPDVPLLDPPLLLPPSSVLEHASANSVRSPVNAAVFAPRAMPPEVIPSLSLPVLARTPGQLGKIPERTRDRRRAGAAPRIARDPQESPTIGARRAIGALASGVLLAPP